jgi:hypothetical protein
MANDTTTASSEERWREANNVVAQRLAAARSVEWVSRFLRVQATFTRNVIDASAGSRASERALRTGGRAGRAALDGDRGPYGRNEVT